MENILLKKATTLHNQGKIADAKKLYQQILTKEPNNAHAIHFLGLLASEENQLDIAKQNLETAIRLQPNNAIFHHNTAGFLSRIGDIEHAISHFKQAINLKPDYAEAYQGLTECTQFKGDTNLIDQINRQLNRNALSDLQANYMHFAVAKIHADSQNYDQAFHHYLLGNKLKHAKFNPDTYHQQIADQINTFTSELIYKRKEWGLYSHTPIFILGMPRSGTTLVEQILASHSSVYGAGELSDIADISRALMDKTRSNNSYPLCIPALTHLDIISLGIQYNSRLLKLSSGTERVINKHPLNFRHIGLILSMFPNARIIHTARDPLDTCLSCFFQNFSKGQEYSFDLENLGEFYNGYRKLMTHWKSVYPDKIFDIEYEDIVSNQEKITRKLVQFCNLPWEDNCLSHHKTERPVATASKYQVRQPIYKSSIKRWKHYEKHLQPLIDKLSMYV